MTNPNQIALIVEFIYEIMIQHNSIQKIVNKSFDECFLSISSFWLLSFDFTFLVKIFGKTLISAIK